MPRPTDAEMDARVEALSDADLDDLSKQRGVLTYWRPGPVVCRTAEEALRLRAAIRKHRDYRGDDRRHLDDAELYAVLPEGDTRPARGTAVTLENCARCLECRQQGREYISPQRRIDELEAETQALRDEIARLEMELDTYTEIDAEP